jgi:branched-subunit amino acid ABC-type transport system permease component
LGLIGALGFGCAGMVALALGVNRLVWRPLVGSPVIALLMVTIGLGTMVRAAAVFLFQGLPAGLPLPHRRQDRLYGIEKMNAYCMEVKIFPSH